MQLTEAREKCCLGRLLMTFTIHSYTKQISFSVFFNRPREHY